MQNNTVRVGLIGLGKMGQNHLRNLVMLKQCEVGFVYDANAEHAESIASKYNVKSSQNLDEDLQAVDAVIIVSPSSTHYDYILKVSDYVKYIFVEKPLTDSVDTTQKVIALAEEKDLKVQVGFIERYNAAISAMEKVLQNSSKVINTDFSRTNKVSARITDVDVIIDLMIHDIDLALKFNGKPKVIDAHGFIDNGMIEYVRAIITHENGSFSNIVASRMTEKRIRNVCATCEDMYVEADLFNKSVSVNKQSTTQYLDEVTISSKEETINVRPQEGLLLELADFVKWAGGEEVDVPNQYDALAAIEVASTIQDIIKKAQ